MAGWGIPFTVTTSLGFRLVTLLVPLWVAPLVALVVGGPPVALAMLLAPFIFIPGLYTIANVSRWPAFIRFLASLVYLVGLGALSFIEVSWLTEFLYQ
jgi:hypothetical protein